MHDVDFMKILSNAMAFYEKFRETIFFQLHTLWIESTIFFRVWEKYLAFPHSADAVTACLMPSTDLSGSFPVVLWSLPPMMHAKGIEIVDAIYVTLFSLTETRWGLPFERWCTLLPKLENNPPWKLAKSSWCRLVNYIWKFPWTRNYIITERLCQWMFIYKTIRISLWKRLKCQCGNLQIFAYFPPRSINALWPKLKASKYLVKFIFVSLCLSWKRIIGIESLFSHHKGATAYLWSRRHDTQLVRYVDGQKFLNSKPQQST